MLGEATLHVSRTFAGERNTASHSVCRPAKALPWGLWHPILMQFYSGPLMHLLSGVDTHGYYGDADPSSKYQPVGGLVFPGHDPNYWDFMYFSFVVGMTFQVSDVQVEASKLRREV